LFLVISFLSSASICFCFGADFLGLVFVIIYVGAIAVLFLFVVMMLDIKLTKINFKTIIYFILFFFLLFIHLYILNSLVFINFDFLNFTFINFDSLGIEFYLAQTLYNYFLLGFLISGIILLVAMLGSILLTLNFSVHILKKKTQYTNLIRSDNFLTFFNSKT
jgi:NADH-quinone oxidoreductase subunit J